MDDAPSPGVLPAAGWYADPHGQASVRWWDGERWTEHFAGAPGGVQPGASPLQTDGFAVAALVVSIIGGVVLGAIFALVALRRIKQGRRSGRGLAIAALCVNAFWIVVIVLALTVLKDKPNTARFSGQQQRIAAVADRFENAADDEDGTAMCATFTTQFAALLARGEKSCASFITKETAGKIQAHIEVKSIRLRSGGRATLLVDEGGTSERWQMVREGGEWKIAKITKG